MQTHTTFKNCKKKEGDDFFMYTEHEKMTLKMDMTINGTQKIRKIYRL